MARRRAPASRFSLLCVVLVSCAALAEAVLRRMPPMPDVSPAPATQAPVMLEPDALLGWKPKPGHYVYPGYAPLEDGLPAPDVEVTITPQRTRFTGTSEGRPEDAIVLVGCSFTWGQAVSDRDTWAYKLREALGRPVYDYAVPGYGTYQAYLRLDEAFDALPVPPRYVVYGFAAFHDTRNAPAITWLRALHHFGGADAGYVGVPWASVAADGSLEPHPPIAYPDSVLRSPWRLYRLLYDFGLRTLAAPRTRRSAQTTIAILQAMQRKVAERGSRLVVMQLLRPGSSDAKVYAPFLHAGKLPWVECDAPKGDAYVVKGEGHPSGLAHSHYASCIADYLRGLERANP